MKKNNGFTLIELLAVLVILAVIALITTPIVLTSIATANTKASKESARGYVSSLEFYCARELAANGIAPSLGTAISNVNTVSKGAAVTVVAGTGTFTDCVVTGNSTFNGYTLAQLAS